MIRLDGKSPKASALIEVTTETLPVTEQEGLTTASLFKYLPPERKDIFQTHCVRYSQPAVFNDPFEARPHFTGFGPAAAWEGGYSGRFEKVLRDQYLAMSSEFREQMPYFLFSALLENQRPIIYDIFRKVDASFVPEINAMMHKNFAEQLGVFSLSEVKDDQLMWSHYARSHQGFVIEFDPTDRYFTRRNVPTDDLWQLQKVAYAERRPRTTVIDFDMQAILLTKHISWSYEREWKDFRPLNQASRVIDAMPFPIHLFAISPRCIHSVIFGAKMEINLKDELMSTIRTDKAFSHVELCEVVLDDRDYAMSIRRLPRAA
jgi:hypothetical protein